MVARNVYCVVAHDQGWLVTSEGRTPIGPFANRAEAIDSATRAAEAHLPSQVIIYTREGDRESARTYGRDRFPG